MSWSDELALLARTIPRGWFGDLVVPEAVEPPVGWFEAVEALLAVELQPARAALLGSQEQLGQLAAVLRAATFAGIGAHQQRGELAGILRPATFAGTNITSGPLTATLQPARAALIGGQQQVGQIGATLRPAAINLTGSQTQTGAMAAQMRAATAALTGNQSQSGQLAATLRAATFAGSGGQKQLGQLAVALRAALFSGSGGQQQHGTLAAQLQAALTNAAGSSKSLVLFDAFTLGGSGGASSRAWAHPTDGNCLAVVFTNTTNSAPTCTYGGVTIPRVYGPVADGGVFPYTSYISIFVLVSNSIPQGSNTVSVNQAGTASAATAMSFRNAGSIGSVIADTSSGNINQNIAPNEGQAAICGYVGGSSNFGTLSPNQAANYGFITFVAWGTVGGWGLDTGSGINFSGSHSGAKSGAVVLINAA
ncbi:hypothetical protein [Mycobacterium sp. DL440]|uniref:hypothetical protein n=1 Tax=Mycobacterium sp. DL440 TaxID=2675523 RepID=UPI00141FB896|nr:hypothetical protein [Mycobacterium sp. DL440]